MRITESIPSRLDMIPDFVSGIIERLLFLPLDEDVIFSVKLCLHEAVINAVEHGNKLDSRLTVTVVIAIEKNMLIAEVTDRGEGFDFKKIPDPTSQENMFKPEGRGIFLIRHLMDKVSFLNKGRTVKMVKILQKRRRVKVDILMEKINDVIIVVLEGEINVSNANETKSKFAKLLQDGERKILVDFEKVVFIDSSGLAILIEMVQRLGKVNGKLRLCNVNRKIKGIFEIVKIHKLISIYDNRQAALEDF
jgi:serine/threonine-protein kinase RsbW